MRAVRPILPVVALCVLTSTPPAWSQTGFSSLAADPPQPQRLPGPAGSQFKVQFENGAIVSLRAAHDTIETDYLAAGARLGDVALRFRFGEGEWTTAGTAQLATTPAATFQLSDDGKSYDATYAVNGADGSSGLSIKTRFGVATDAVHWTVSLENRTDQPIEISDLAFPVSINRNYGPQGRGNRRGGAPSGVIMKHSFISADGSFLYWMRANSVGPFLAMIPDENTPLEYWDQQGVSPAGGGEGARGSDAAGGSRRGGQGGARGGNRRGGYSLYVHSQNAGEVARARGTRWRLPQTSTRLAPQGQSGSAVAYGYKLRWADNYDAVRQVLVDEGRIDVHVVPGMTVPTDLSAQFALRTSQDIHGIDAEFPEHTKIESLGANGHYRLYRVHFAKLGENRLTVRFGNDRRTYLEFFVTEPVETLIKKRGAFLAKSQHRDASKWYNGLITDWNMKDHVLPSPDNYDLIRGFRIYAVTCDDPGLAKPAYLASKLAEYPVQSEVDALDDYIEHFVWGGLQRTTQESYPYGIYGIQDWKRNRDSEDPGPEGQLHLWRVYDYPHIIVMYYNMYRVAKHHPQIKTKLPASEYLKRAYGTTKAMFTVPLEIRRWSPYNTGFYNELMIVNLIDDLEAAEMTTEAAELRGLWERKVNSFTSGRQDLFRSEYAFDSTGFESTHALAKYALRHSTRMGERFDDFRLDNADRFMHAQMAANLFCRGWLEPAYYYLGSDYRGGGGNSYVLTYMSQMGGWSVLDYGLNFARDPDPYLRLGYASYLSAWALMNTGTPESNFGYWYSGKENDGGAGGGFEPAPFGQTWLGQPHSRGSWYYSCEIDLGYCGALRMAATLLTDDDVFGRVCLGGDWRATFDGLEITPKDGIRRRFYAMLDGGKLQLELDSDRFAAGQPLVLKEDLSQIAFRLESDNPAEHRTTLRLTDWTPGKYELRGGMAAVPFEIPPPGGPAPNETIVVLTVPGGGTPAPVTISRLGE